MNHTDPRAHRIWLLAWSGRTGKSCSEEAIVIFQNRMAALLARYEREQPADPVLLESLRLRELARLMKELEP